MSPSLNQAPEPLPLGSGEDSHKTVRTLDAPISRVTTGSLAYEIFKFLSKKELAAVCTLSKLVYSLLDYTFGSFEVIEISRLDHLNMWPEIIVQKCTKLRELRFIECSNLNDIGLVHISKCSGKSLQTVALTKCNAISSIGLYYLFRMPNLKHLTLNGCKIFDDQCLAELVQRIPNLQSLSINDCNKLGSCLEEIKKFANLKSLSIGQLNQISSPEFSSLAQMKSLENLNLGGCREFNDLKSIAELKDSLKHLDVHHCTFLHYDDFDDLSTCIKLESLNMARTVKMNPAEMLSIGKLVNLKHLNLSECDVNDAGVAHLKSLNHLEYLNLSFCKELTEVSMEVITSRTKLKYLNLAKCSKITPRGYTNMNMLVLLEELDLSYSKLIDSSLIFLNDMVNLKILNLSWCSKITGTGLAQFNSKHRKLTEIKLSTCKNLLGYNALVNLKQLPNLTHLDLSRCSKITKVISDFEHLADYRRLKILDLSKSEITEQDRAFFSKICDPLGMEFISYYPKVHRFQKKR